MMYVSEVAQLVRAYTDDPDQSFFSNANLAVALKVAYAEFRALVGAKASEIYELSHSIQGNGTKNLSLNNILLGQTPTQRRCMRITRIERVSDTTPSASFQGILEPAQSLESLGSSSVGMNPRWLLKGTELRFDRDMSAALRINYLPTDNINWLAGISAPTAYIDDLEDFHDLIALICCRQYAIKDYAVNPVLEGQYQKRLSDLNSFLARGRSGQGNRYIQSEDLGW